MQYLGNYADWIQQEWVQYLLTSAGYARPGEKVLENTFEAQQNSSVADMGYKDKTYWYKYTPDNFPFDIKMPIDVVPELWWFVKMLPGNLIPIHRDQEEETGKRTNLYWMSLYDYEPGHIFVNNDQLLTNYKAGDLFMFEDANSLHCSCNVGFTPRLIFNFTTYK